MNKSQFKWYLLEIILAYLMQVSWYKIILKPSSLDETLKLLSNWLNVQGRWWYHQVDVLWEFKWIIPFNYPIRLITEAKFYQENKKVGIDIVRSEIWILSDINQNIFSIWAVTRTVYNYRTVIFSASWFTKNAMSLAIAHQIQLVDLNDDCYSGIKDIVEIISNRSFNNREPTNEVDQREFLKKFKKGLFEWVNNNHILSDLNLVRNLRNSILVWAWKRGIFLLFKVDSLENFLSFANTNTDLDIEIHWSEWVSGWKLWTIIPYSRIDTPPFELSFYLPSFIYDKVFNADNIIEESLNQKDIHFETVSVYYRDRIINLKYDRSFLL